MCEPLKIAEISTSGGLYPLIHCVAWAFTIYIGIILICKSYVYIYDIPAFISRKDLHGQPFPDLGPSHWIEQLYYIDHHGNMRNSYFTGYGDTFVNFSYLYERNIGDYYPGTLPSCFRFLVHPFNTNIVNFPWLNIDLVNPSEYECIYELDLFNALWWVDVFFFLCGSILFTFR